MLELLQAFTSYARSVARVNTMRCKLSGYATKAGLTHNDVMGHHPGYLVVQNHSLRSTKWGYTRQPQYTLVVGLENNIQPFTH